MLFFLHNVKRKGLFVIMSNLKKKGLVETCYETLGHTYEKRRVAFMGWELTEEGKSIDLFKDKGDYLELPPPPKRLGLG